jgi:SAM-dependent methyltransferase
MKEYYDALYKENEHYWGRMPSPVTLLLLAHCKSGKVLELGCGQGPDAVFLARKGLDVTALDLSPIAIQQFKEHAQGLRITILEQDMRELPQEKFDVILSRMALQMIEPKERNEYIERLKQTYPDALHAHVIPIQGACFGDAFVCEPDLLKETYADWEILFCEDAWTISRSLNRNGEPYLMRESRIIARRLR